ncbi:MAG: sugar ABC transporter permease [Gorillibacterium sp.]|nr:sugar ABC transporter permease [Gorillibacterium sp.]
MLWPRIRPYAMIAPSIAVFGIFFLYPIAYMVYLSLHSWNFVSKDKAFVGIANFRELFADEQFRTVLGNSFQYTLLTVGLTLLLSLLLALWLNRPGWSYRFVQGAIFTPHIIALVSVSLVWMWLMDPRYGLLNWLLQSVGLPPSQWLNHPKSALLSLVMVAVWKGVGFNALVFIAGLQSIPRDIYEAAELDESRPLTTLFKLTLPMLSPTLFFLAIINLISSFQVFDTISIMTQGGPIDATNTIVFYIYQYGFRFFKIGYASAAGVILLVAVSMMTVIYFKLLNKKIHYR